MKEGIFKMKNLLQKWNSLSLIVRILIGLIIGAILGVAAPKATGLALLGDLFVGALRAVAPILVFVLVIASLANSKSNGAKNMRIGIWENRETLVIESSLNSYLFKMVYRRALNKLAHIDATQRADTRFYEEMQEMLQDTDYYQIEELAKRIEDAVAALPESYREAFVMHRFRDMSYKEIAETLGVSPKTIDYRIQQALKQLRVDLKDYLPLLLPLLFP